MALYMKQDFSPPFLSRKWLAIKFRPNMLLYSREHIICILESCLLFREDSIEVEQESPAAEVVWRAAGGGGGGWLTRGERVLSLVAVGACIALFPPRRLTRATLAHAVACASLPIAIRTYHRCLANPSTLKALLEVMRDYLGLARRAAACVKECSAVAKELESLSSAAACAQALLKRQQTSLAVLLSRASSSLLGNAPWLRADVAWDAVTDVDEKDSFIKIHHAFLVVQSTLLKHIAMAHFIPSVNAQRIYKNHNERIHWLHTTLIPHLYKEYKENFDQLDRMYRLLKNYGNHPSEVKKPGAAMKSWLYSDVHSGVAKANLELKMAVNKCTGLDMFLDAAAMNKEELNVEVLNRDLEDLIDRIGKCLDTAQSSQLRLRKLKSKFTEEKTFEVTESEGNFADGLTPLSVELSVSEPKDEVFYFHKTEDSEPIEPIADVTTAPGKKEKENTRVVLKELKRKLVKREDLMRERERQALSKIMDIKDVPEFPRQMKLEANSKGFISKIRIQKPERLFWRYKIQKNSRLEKKYRVENKHDHKNDEKVFEALTDPKQQKTAPISVNPYNGCLVLTRLSKKSESDAPKSELEAPKSKMDNPKSKMDSPKSKMDNPKSKMDSPKSKMDNPKSKMDSPKSKTDYPKSTTDSLSTSGLSDENFNTIDKPSKSTDKITYKVSKKDLELTPSSSESDFDLHTKEMELLRDVRRHRVARKKNFPTKRGSFEDESMKPVEYSFGTGMAIASVLQVNRKNFSFGQEEVFAGDGEVSGDSGNDEDA